MARLHANFQIKAEKTLRQLDALGRKIPQVERSVILAVLGDIRKWMQQPGRKPTDPIQWDSDRQRKAYFASDGFGRGIPTHRSGAYLEGWRIAERSTASASTFELYNPEPSAMFVGGTAIGTRQSRIHVGRWPMFATGLQKFLPSLRRRLERALDELIDSIERGGE